MAKKGRILLADNCAPVLDSLAEILERAGYQVTRAGTYEQAEKALEKSYFNLAILDLRLRNDEEEHDISGLELAKASSDSIAKILYTTYPSFETSRDALVPDSSGRPPVMSYVSKKESLSVLLNQIENVCQRLGLRRELEIDWSSVDRMFLVGRLSPRTDAEDGLGERVEEFEYLLAQLFPKATRVVVSRLLWQDGSRAALLTRATFADEVALVGLVVVGEKLSMVQESETAQSLSVGHSWPGMPFIEQSARTVRYSGSLLTFGSFKLSDSRSLGDVFRNGPERLFTSSIQHLTNSILPPWYRTVSHGFAEIREAHAIRSQLEMKPDGLEQSIRALQSRTVGLGVLLSAESDSCAYG